MEPITTPTKLASAAGISVPYASQLLSGSRTPSRKLAITIWRRAGVKLGPLADATPEELEILAKYSGSEEPSAHQPTGDRFPFTGRAVA